MEKVHRYYIDNNCWIFPLTGTIKVGMISLISMIRDSGRGEVLSVSTGTADELAATHSFIESFSQDWLRNLVGPVSDILSLASIQELPHTPENRHDHFMTGKGLRNADEFPLEFSGAMYRIDTRYTDGFGCAAIQLMLTCAPISDGEVEQLCPITPLGNFQTEVLQARARVAQ